MTKKKTEGGATKHPWETWFRKKRFQITRNVDFNGRIHGMVAQIRNYASSVGVSVRVKVEGDNIVVTQI